MLSRVPLNCTTDTPMVDALDYGDQSIFANGDGYGRLWELARTLERELAAEKKRPKGLRLAFWRGGAG